MPPQFPTNLDTVNPASYFGTQGGIGAKSQWAALTDEKIRALEEKMGVNGSAVTSSIDYKLTRVTAPFSTSTPELVVASNTPWGGNAIMNSLAKDASDFVCDGANDEDTIQQALDSAGDNGAGVVRLSGGDFNVAAVNFITVPEGVTLMGSGASANGSGTSRLNLVGAHGSGAIVTVLGTNPTNRTFGQRIYDLVVDGNSQDVDGIFLKWANVWHVSGVAVFACEGHGIHLWGASDSVIDHSRIDWCGSTDGSLRAGLHIYAGDVGEGWGADNVHCRDLWFENNHDRAIQVIRAVGASPIANDITIRDCKVETHYQGRAAANAQIVLDRAHGVRLLDNYLYSDRNAGFLTNEQAFLLINDCRGTHVVGNTFSHNNTLGQCMASWVKTIGTNYGVIVTHNQIQHGGTFGPTQFLEWAGTETEVGPGRLNYATFSDGVVFAMEAGTPNAHITAYGTPTYV